MENLTNYRLRNLSKSGKALVIGYLLCCSFGYFYAVINVGQSIGFLPDQIAVKYYGSETKIEKTETAKEGIEEEFSFDEVEETKVQKIARPSFKKIIAEGHFHLFGMASFFLGLAIFGLFTSLSETWKMVAVGSPFVAIIIDNLSFMAIRFIGPQFAYLTIIAGSFMGISFTFLWWNIVRETLRRREVHV